MEADQAGPTRARPIRDFLWFCSGVNSRILAQCPGAEHNKYAGIGATVLFTGLLASFSGGYALFTVFQSLPLALLFGIFWGLLIFNLDRFIVSTIRKDGNLQRQLSMALPRFLLAIVLAVVISKPIELRIFESEILEILQDRRLERLELAEQKFQAKFSEKEAAITALKSEIEAKFQIREKDYQDYKCECDGTCGTGRIGRGSECQRKEAKYLQSNREYQEIKEDNQTRIASLQADLLGLETELSQAKSQLESTFSYGLVARLSASSELPPGPSIFIMLLILLVEISPLLAKILSSRGPYDEIMHKIEQRFYLDQLEEINQRKLELNQKFDMSTSIHEAQVQHELKRRKETLRAITDAQLALIKEQIEEWLQTEKENLRKQKGKK
ncbi:MAG: DUF4407 domain-containing protein [Saprospiraceae bacterium]|nr:DUF4407 domain-containing protein [Saprospiraceae bacterium]MCB0622762.1 DUF4407 domain-containing protein [Saprospiraceae bacterium]